MLVSKSFARRAVRAAKAIQDEVNATLGPTPEQRPAGEYVAIDTMDPEVRNAIDAQDNAIDEQEVTIDKLRKDVDRWMDDLEKRGDETSDNEAAIKALQATLAEQSALLTGQRAAIEALREVFEEVAQGGQHLAGRIDKVEKAREAAVLALRKEISAKDLLVRRMVSKTVAYEGKKRKAGDRATLQRTQLAHDRLHEQIVRVAVGASGEADGFLSRLNRLEAQADKCVRFQAIHPPVTEEDNDD